MQFIPSTWQAYRADGNHDGVADPEQIDDATFAAGDYLCASGANLSQPNALRAAVFSYNRSKAYVHAVLKVAAHYLGVSLRSLGVDPARLPLPRESPASRDRSRGVTPTPGPSTTAVPTVSPTPSRQPNGATPTPSPLPNSTTEGPTAAPSDPSSQPTQSANPAGPTTSTV
jgi:hypothetical protein